MANTTSGTHVFDKNFSIDEIIEEGYERIGMSGVSGYQLKSARRSLNIMFQEWANRGLHYWEVANNSITLVANQAVYTMFRSTGDGTSDATDVPYRFVPCMSSGLAYYLSIKYAPQRTQELKLLYEDELQRALAEDGSASSTYITPKAYYPGT